jgi:predicted nuclease of predicted toxin-antitoxin system
VSRVRFLFDEDFNGHIVRGFRRRQPNADACTVREAGIEGASDPIVLGWAAENHRLVVSHDRRTMAGAGRSRIREGLPMAGLILVRQDCPVAVAIEELELVSEATTAEEWRDVIAFLPL